MTFVVGGLLASCVSVGVLSGLFLFEKKRGTRIMPKLRHDADYAVAHANHLMHRAIEYVTVHLTRQVGHYMFHLVLSKTLNATRFIERGLRSVMRTNKTLARTAERERASRTKLEEVALHKMEVALSEKEQAIRKERALNGS